MAVRHESFSNTSEGTTITYTSPVLSKPANPRNASTGVDALAGGGA